jgi:zinc transporter, ZIP family
VIRAFAVGATASAALLIGALIAIVRPVRERGLGLIMGFGAGVLISAVAYDLVLEGVEASSGAVVTWGLFAGSIVFYVGDLFIDRAGGEDRKPVGRPDPSAAPKAIVLGTVLDGVPESVVLGVSLLSGEGVSVAVFVAVFISNLPEAIAATTGLLATNMRHDRILWMWGAIVVVSGLAALAGYGLADTASPNAVAFAQAFAGGAILTMLADSMIPEAFEHGGSQAGLVTTLGFVVAFALVQIERAH